jgi:O-antigen/teichoic acid export membrane protein
VNETLTPAAPVQGALSRQVSRAMLWNTVWQVARLVAGAAGLIVVANFLPKDSYGAVVTIGAMATTIGLFADLGIERGLAKFLPEIEARFGRRGVTRTLHSIIGLKLVLLAITLLLALIFHGRLFDYWLSKSATGEEGDAIRATIVAYRWVFFWALMALVLLGALFDVYMQALTAYFKQRASGAIGFVVQVLSPILRIVVVLVGWGTVGYVGALVAVPLIATGMAAWKAATIQRELQLRPTQETNGARLPQRLAGFTGLSYWQQLTEYFYSIEFMLLALPGFAAVGSLKFAHSLITQLLTALWSPLLGVQIPLFARLQQRNEPRQLNEAYRILSKFLAAIMIPAAIGLFLLVPNLIALLAPKYADGVPAARIIALTFCLDAAISVPLAILMAYEQFRPMLIARTFAVVAIPLVLFAVPRYGLIGAAAVMGGTRLLCDGLAMVFAIRHFGIQYPVRFALRVLGASLALMVVVAPLALLVLAPPANVKDDKLMLLGFLLGNAALGGLGALVFLGVFKLTGGLDQTDRQRIRELRLPFAERVLRFL